VARVEAENGHFQSPVVLFGANGSGNFWFQTRFKQPRVMVRAPDDGANAPARATPFFPSFSGNENYHTNISY
jgi:hypothetical protein